VAFLPTYFCALYWKRTTKRAAMASLLTGTVAMLFCLVFMHEKESAALGVCNAVFGRDVLIDCYPIQVIDPILYALPLSIAAIVIVTLLDNKKPSTN
jgi:SSS family solute:Na+ symporter